MENKFLCVSAVISAHFFILISSFVFPVAGFPVNTIVNKMTVTTNNPSALASDIQSCACIPLASNCEFKLGYLVVPEIKCRKDEQFCCSIAHTQTQKSQTTDSYRKIGSNITSNLLTRNSSNIIQAPVPAPVPVYVYTPPRVKIVVATETAAANNLYSSTLDKFNATRNNNTLHRKPKTYCRCKLREKCPHEHTDYSFGFYCSYDKVRCCEPTDNNSTMQQRNDNDHDNNDEEEEDNQKDEDNNEEAILKAKQNQTVPITSFVEPIIQQRTTLTHPPPQLPNSYLQSIPHVIMNPDLSVSQKSPSISNDDYFGTNSPYRQTNSYGSRTGYLANTNGGEFILQPGLDSGLSSPRSESLSFLENFARILG